MSATAGIRSLAASFPAAIRGNDYWRERYPELVKDEERRTLARLFRSQQKQAGPLDAFEQAMAPYLSDPFRGARERRVLAPGQRAASIELDAARRALAAAELEPKDIDLLICCSFLPDQVGVGNATPLAKALGLRCAAWNVETTCSSALVALQNASALIRVGQHRNALVVISCTYSRVADEDDTMCWFLGDGAGAFVVSDSPGAASYLTGRARHTGETCNTFFYEVVPDAERGARIRMDCTPETGKILYETAEPYLRECCEAAVQAAGAKLSEVDCFVFNTPTAWYADFCARALGVPRERTVDTYPEYANIGPALMPVNLLRAAQSGLLRPGNLVLLYTVGSVSSAGAALLRWGNVGLGGVGNVAG
ncbi:MAG TPA: 3-oxoacyl-[acyl-carrier-protein] synthase III C-terminal domain-containing protein [Myxococcota bacterium]|nr:3-oxoacyl-[acyl-carrier-protein] synthase III C-terminal domain-containing protein [Myxococcota bacterium]